MQAIKYLFGLILAHQWQSPRPVGIFMIRTHWQIDSPKKEKQFSKTGQKKKNNFQPHAPHSIPLTLPLIFVITPPPPTSKFFYRRKMFFYIFAKVVLALKPINRKM